MAEETKTTETQDKNINVNLNVTPASINIEHTVDNTGNANGSEVYKSKIAAGLLHLLLGGIGVGHFYMGEIGLGIVDILFCWTGIPALVNFIRGIVILCESDATFCWKHNVNISINK